MKLVFFDFNINYGGAPQGSVYLAKRLNSSNEVHIVDAYGACDDYVCAVRDAGLPIHIAMPDAKNICVGSSGISRIFKAMKQIPDFIKLSLKLSKVLREIDPDVIWVNNQKSLMFLTFNLSLLKYPTSLYVRFWATPDQVGSLFKFLIKHRVGAVIAHARAAVEQLKDRGIRECKIHYVPNTIDFELVRKKAEIEVTDLKKTSPTILLPAARPVHEKGHLSAIKAIARLKTKGYESIMLQLTGRVATGVKDGYLEKLKETVAELSLEENVDFIGWQDNIPALIKAADIVILPSHTEGFPRVILESMLLKTPVCTTMVGGIPDAIEDGVTGVSCEVDDVESLANGILRILKNEQLRERITENAFLRVTQEFSPQINTKVISQVFEGIARRENV